MEKMRVETNSAYRLMSNEEMKQYTASELEKLQPKRYNKYGYWKHSKDSNIPLVIVHDWKAVMR